MAIDPDDPLSHKPLVEARVGAHPAPPRRPHHQRDQARLRVRQRRHRPVERRARATPRCCPRTATARPAASATASAARPASTSPSSVSDTFGRTWRRGVTDVAIGSAGIAAGRSTCAAPPTPSAARCRSPRSPSSTRSPARPSSSWARPTGIPVAVVRGVDPELVPRRQRARRDRPPPRPTTSSARQPAMSSRPDRTVRPTPGRDRGGRRRPADPGARWRWPALAAPSAAAERSTPRPRRRRRHRGRRRAHRGAAARPRVAADRLLAGGRSRSWSRSARTSTRPAPTPAASASPPRTSCSTARARSVQSAPGSGGAGHRRSRTPADTTMSGDVVRNCRVSGFLNSIRVTRTGFRTLAAGHEFDHTLSDVVIEDSEVSGSRGVGIYVDGYVTDVTIRDVRGDRRRQLGDLPRGRLAAQHRHRQRDPRQRLHRERRRRASSSPSAACSSASGASGGRACRSTARPTTPSPATRSPGNSAGGVFVYTNCGEYKDRAGLVRATHRRRPQPDRGQHLRRRHHRRVGRLPHGREHRADGLQRHPLRHRSAPERHPRPGRRATPCGPTPSTTSPTACTSRTTAPRSLDNSFSGPSGAYHAVVVGTRVRTTALDHPVTGTVDLRQRVDHRRQPEPVPLGARRARHHRHRQPGPGPNRSASAPARSCPTCSSSSCWPWPTSRPAARSRPDPPGLTMPLLGPLPPCAPSIDAGGGGRRGHRDGGRRRHGGGRRCR